MLVRLALESEIEEVGSMLKANMEETRPDLPFVQSKFEASYYSYINHASPTVFVIEDKGEIVGLAAADILEYRAADGIFTTQEVLYVKPENRGSRAAVLLMKHLIEWSKMLGAKEIVGGNDNDFNSERTAKFLEHFKFKRVGFSMRREL